MLFQGTQTDPISIILNLLFFVFIFISIFYGTKIQAYRSQKNIESALNDLKKWDSETQTLTVKKIKKYCNENLTIKDIEKKLQDFLTFVMIQPVSLDPSGIIPKIEHIMDIREERYMDEVKEIASKADDTQVHNLENLLEAAMAVNQVYRILLHYLLLGKKTKSYILLLQLEMQLTLITAMAKAYVSAAKAFAEGSPVGDALGPMVAATFIRDINPENSVPHEKIAYETILQNVRFENRTILVVRAKGPGGTVGKPGEAIKKLIEQHGEKVKLVIMIDAGLKLEGDKTGSVIVGVGAAIGGIGVEKYKIEDTSTSRKIPVDAIICRESLEDAINTMKKPIINSVPIIVDKIKTFIRKETIENDYVIVAGIGNSIGIGI